MLQFVQTYINVLQSNHEAMGQIHQDLLNQYNQFSIDRLLDQFALSKHTGLEKPSKFASYIFGYFSSKYSFL